MIKNYIQIFLAAFSKVFGRGVTFRRRLFVSQRILEKNYPVGSAFCFLQVGANDGKSFDFLYDFVIQREVSGVVIEPIKAYYNELCENYKNQDKIVKVNKAVHKTAKVVTVFKVEDSKLHGYPDWTKGIASFNKEHLTKFVFLNETHIIEEQVAAASLMDIIGDSKIFSFNYLQIDTEGYDFEVLDMLDFKKHKPAIIKAEFVNLPEAQKQSMRTKLLNNGYYVFNEGIDLVGVNLRKIKL
ncbi:FkbM family methyltransferase [Lacinutrix sp. WUR7]|uniref:FkbM family methyltransferase n=1 Tax=Lacinutrix sp. WUR7 TaxID=2653681 RepID=UPI00193DFD70|nr:FkbM family methyltransferase [Lacinutrix sp. WUR7]QRM87794.1 FkbM family methyltransferase [Lacinutrix sp. WUR7]